MATIELRRGTAATWTSVNPVLHQGEPGYETDTGKLKIGDGSTAWGSLGYLSAGGAGPPAGSAGGSLTGTYPNPTIAASAVTNTMLAGSIAAGKLAGSIAFSQLVGTDINLDGGTVTRVNDIQIRRDTAAHWTSTNPTLAAGEMGYETDTKKLKFGDGSTAWASLAYTLSGTGAGSVTSVDMTVPSLLSVSGNPITSSGTLALTYSGTALPIANGGTSATSATAATNALLPSQTSNSGKVLGTNGTNTSWVSAGGAGSVTSVGITAPAIFTVTGSPVTTSGTLTLAYSGTALPIANGGTANTTANAGFNALAPSQTSNSGKYLTTNGTDTSWAAVSASGNGGGVFGDGNDGAAVFDGSTTVAGIAPGGGTYVMSRDYYFTDITISTGITIYTQGFRLFGNGTLTMNGTAIIQNDAGQDGGNGSSSAAGSAGANNATSSWGQNNWAGNGGGGNRRTTAGGTAGTAGTAGTSPQLSLAGGQGGSTTGGTPGTGGAGGVCTAPVTAQGYPRSTPEAMAGWKYRISTGVVFFWSGGSGGGGGATSSSAASTSVASGGGGGAGGLCFVAAKTIVLSTTCNIKSNGGQGGNGFVSAASGLHGAGGGGGGSGGVCIVCYGSITNSNRVIANGGAGGTGASFGGGTAAAGATGGAGYVLLLAC